MCRTVHRITCNEGAEGEGEGEGEERLDWVGGQRHEEGWAPGPLWTSAENLALTSIQTPDRPARSESLRSLRYRGPHPKCKLISDS